METKEILTEQINEAIAVWQNEFRNLPLDADESLNKIIENNKRLATMLSDAIVNYTNSVSIKITKTTIFGTGGGPIVAPWSPANISEMNNGNHGYIEDDFAQTTEIETGILGGKLQYKKIRSTPMIIRI